MASRHSMARPKRAGEAFARTHHNDKEDKEDTKRVKFDVRNPSILAPDAEDEDAVLEADVIGSRSNTKRGAVNIDGYDSDSDNENINARAGARKKGAVNILDQLDNYDAKEGPHAVVGGDDAEDDDDDDMFAANGDDGKPEKDQTGDQDDDFTKSGRKKKSVQFLDSAQIEGQETTSRSGGRVHLDERESSDDDEDLQLAIEEEGVDEEVGAGGLKRNAPKVEAFHLREEMEEGGFDQDGNYVRKAGDPNAVHDNWLDGLSKKEMRRAAAAHERREAEARTRRIQEDGVLVAHLLAALIPLLERTETPLEALARLGRLQGKRPGRAPKWKRRKKAEGMELDQEPEPAQARVKEAIDAITDAADKLLSRGHDEIYDEERELLVREYARETGEEWVDKDDDDDDDNGNNNSDGKMWEYRWTTQEHDSASTQGPFDGPTMKAWMDAGYFGHGVEFRPVGEDDWVATAEFV